jgi:hypothetical protein
MIDPDDFRWAIQNDWQVYIKPYGSGAYIAVRKGGITACGKDYHYDRVTGIEFYSRENVGKVYYKTIQKAMDKLPEVYKYLRYGTDISKK